MKLCALRRPSRRINVFGDGPARAYKWRALKPARCCALFGCPEMCAGVLNSKWRARRERISLVSAARGIAVPRKLREKKIVAEAASNDRFGAVGMPTAPALSVLPLY